MLLFDRAAALLFRLPWRWLLVALATVTIFRSGVWAMPNLLAQLDVAKSLYVNPFPDAPTAHYLMWNYLGPFIAGQLGLTTLATHFAFFLFFAIATWVVMVYCVQKYLPAREARVSLVLYAIMPVAATAFYWVGMDGLTLFLMTLAFVRPRHVGWAVLCGTLLGMQHFEQGFLAACAVYLSLILAGSKAEKKLLVSRPWAAGLVAGVFFGKVILIAWFAYHDVVVNSGRIYWFSTFFKMLIRQWLLHWPIIMWSVFSVGWAALMKFWEFKEWRLAFFLPLAGLLMVSLMGADHTRMLAILTFPLMMVWVLGNKTFLAAIDDRLAGLFVTLGFLAPWIWCWNGEPRWSVFFYDVFFASAKLVGWPALPDGLAIWPFLLTP